MTTKKDRKLVDVAAVLVPTIVALMFAKDLLIPSIQAKQTMIPHRSQLPRLSAFRPPVLDVSLQEDGGAVAAVAPDGVDMSNAERFLIKAQGYADLSREYRVGADDTISIPGMGRVTLIGLSLPAFEATLAKRIASATGRDVDVSVEILEYRPVFVAGQDSRLGAFPWRPGMTVLQAMAFAGGTFRGSSPGVDQDADTARLKKAVSEQKRHYAALARIQAERKGASTIELPAKLVELVGQPEAERMIRPQILALQNRKSAIDAKIAAIDNAMKLTTAELGGLTDLVASMKTDLQSTTKYQEVIEGLQAKGIVSRGRTYELTTRNLDFANQFRMLKVSISNVRAQLSLLERDRVNLTQSRQAEIDEESLKLEGIIAQLDIEIDAARANYEKVTGRVPAMDLIASEPPKKLAMKYTIVRRTSTGTSTMDAAQDTIMRPGDTLIVGNDQISMK